MTFLDRYVNPKIHETILKRAECFSRKTSHEFDFDVMLMISSFLDLMTLLCRYEKLAKNCCQTPSNKCTCDTFYCVWIHSFLSFTATPCGLFMKALSKPDISTQQILESIRALFKNGERRVFQRYLEMVVENQFCYDIYLALTLPPMKSAKDLERFHECANIRDQLRDKWVVFHTEYPKFIRLLFA